MAADGTKLHEQDGWREAKVGCIYSENQRFKDGKYYVAEFDNSQRFGWNSGKSLFGEGTRATDRRVNERLSLL